MQARHALLALALCIPLAGQYFGQNKVRHKTLDFHVLKTQHFDIYFYPAERQAAEQVGRMAERWNTRYSKLLNHVLTTRQPVILYASHTDFEQSPVVPGMISESEGGVTLALGRKVVLPLAGSLAETDHVLGHELVHAFQYDMTTAPTGNPMPGVARLPLWFVEGMAEYLSLGPEDSNTAMWLRDAVAGDRFPTLKDLNNYSKYFPYRFGQAFWAFVGGRYGDNKIGPLLLVAGRSGSVQAALQSVLHVNEKQLSAEWKQAALAADDPVLKATVPVSRERVLIAANPNKIAKLNVSPSVSPDGHWVMFFSERGLFSIDLYLANVQTGQVVRKITSTAISTHFNNLEFVNSAGAWSADGKRFAFGHVNGGTATVSIYDLASGRVSRAFPIRGVGEVFNPTWSPDSTSIAFSAIAGGLTNLYLLDVRTGAVRQLTNDAFAELQPAWSADGTEFAFTTDRFTADMNDLSHGQYRVALYNLQTGAITPAVPEAGGNQSNPQWSPDGQTLYFLSDASGIPNLYAYANGTARGLTNLQSGVSGITSLSPAFSVARGTGEIVFSAFTAGGYDLVRLSPSAAPGAEGATSQVAGLHPALLPPRSADVGQVASMITNWQGGLPATTAFPTTPYHPSLALDYVAPPSVAVGYSPYGTLLGGGTALHFSDVLNYNSLTVAFEALTNNGAQGFLRNLSAQVQYLNEHHRWTLGFAGGQVPFVTGSFGAAAEVVNGVPVGQTQSTTFWELDRQAVGILAYPFSRAQRVEFTAGYSNIGFAAEQETQVVNLVTGNLISDQRQNLPAPKALNFGVGSAALVYDTSIFGGTSPIRGQSYRLQIGGNAGSIDFATGLLDYRKYIGVTRSVSVAGRFLHYGRYGGGANDPRLQDLFLGYPSLVRGYDFNSFSSQECGAQFSTTGVCPAFDRLLGTKIAVGSAELRLELLGTLGIWQTPSVPPIELAPFFDAGEAWGAANAASAARQAVTSEGLTLRVNLFGAFVGSVSYAIPNNRPQKSHVWEFSLLPGY